MKMPLYKKYFKQIKNRTLKEISVQAQKTDIK